VQKYGVFEKHFYLFDYQHRMAALFLHKKSTESKTVHENQNSALFVQKVRKSAKTVRS